MFLTRECVTITMTAEPGKMSLRPVTRGETHAMMVTRGAVTSSAWPLPVVTGARVTRATDWSPTPAVQVCSEYHHYSSLLILLNSDINECETIPNLCSHNCHNTEGSYECSCHSGYSVDPDNSSLCQVNRPASVKRDHHYDVRSLRER